MTSAKTPELLQTERSRIPVLRNHHAKADVRQGPRPAQDRFDFDGATIDVARRLVGALLMREPDASAAQAPSAVLRIVETEAYLPLVDPSCHAYRGPTRRNASAFGRPGTAYVYFVYGNHFCLNVATERPGVGAAVLLRAAEPLEGAEAMRGRRPGIPDARLASGPGNLCRALSIDRSHDGLDLSEGPLRIVRGTRPARVFESPRIGLSVARGWPLRFFDPDCPSVSATKRGRETHGCVAHLVDGIERSVL